MSSLSFFPLIPAVTTASAAPVYHGGMIPCLGDVEPVNTRWLIKGYFPMGAVSVVAGPGGVGKGVFMADVVAAVTTGRPTMLFPDAAVAQGNVLVLTSEDDPGMSLAPRMIAAEADMRRVFYATPGWYWQQKKKKLVVGASFFELIDELHSEFDETISMCEDALFVSTVLNKIQSCCATKSILYYYRENPQGASHLANAQKYKQAIEVSKKIMLFDLIRQTEENLRIYKDFQAVWELKYMLALSAEDKSKDNGQIRSEQELYRKELLPYTKNTMDKRVKLVNFIIMLPYPIFQLSLSAINNVLRKR